MHPSATQGMFFHNMGLFIVSPWTVFASSPPVPPCQISAPCLSCCALSSRLLQLLYCSFPRLCYQFFMQSGMQIC